MIYPTNTDINGRPAGGTNGLEPMVPERYSQSLSWQSSGYTLDVICTKKGDVPKQTHHHLRKTKYMIQQQYANVA